MFGVLEPRAGILFPEMCVAAHLNLALKAGAQVRTNEKLHQWTEDPTGVRLETAHGLYHAKKLVLTSGAWMSTRT